MKTPVLTVMALFLISLLSVLCAGLDKEAQDEFFEDCIVSRAFLSWKSKLLKKSVSFRGLRVIY